MIDNNRLRALIRSIIREDRIPGGLADDLDVGDIAKRHGVDQSEIEKELVMGVKVEMEHVDDPRLSREIALDHLYEDPVYYTKLKAMESK